MLVNCIYVCVTLLESHGRRLQTDQTDDGNSGRVSGDDGPDADAVVAAGGGGPSLFDDFLLSGGRSLGGNVGDGLGGVVRISGKNRHGREKQQQQHQKLPQLQQQLQKQLMLQLL